MMTQAGQEKRAGNPIVVSLNEVYAVRRSDGQWRSAEVIQTRGILVSTNLVSTTTKYSSSRYCWYCCSVLGFRGRIGDKCYVFEA